MNNSFTKILRCPSFLNCGNYLVPDTSRLILQNYYILVTVARTIRNGWALNRADRSSCGDMPCILLAVKPHVMCFS